MSRPPYLRPIAWVAVAAGGAAGTALRDALGTSFPVQPGAFPVTTFAINVSGAFLLGLLLESLARQGPDVGARRLARLAGGTGLLGGFTTYSTFVLESVLRARQGDLMLALAYDAASLAVGFVAAAAAVRAVHRLARRREVHSL